MKQTLESLRILTIEETYELSDAILNCDYENIKEEIGDLMLHMVFYSKIGSEKQLFDMADVLNAICEKLIKRHPHIYSDVKVANEKDVKLNWEKIKLAEGKKSVLGGVPNSLPAMVKAYRIQDKTAQIGFQWSDIKDVWQKVEEEISEFKEAEATGHAQNMEEEFGDILFSLINYARYTGIDPESALQRVNNKFKSRFEYIENQSTKSISEMSLDEMDRLWNEAKNKE